MGQLISKKINVLLPLLIIAMCISVLVAFVLNLNNNKQKQLEISKINEQLNEGLPINMGSLCMYDSIRFDGRTIRYYYSIANGIDVSISDTKQLWKDNYETIKEIFEYRILSVTNKSVLEYLYENKVFFDMILFFYTPDGKFTDWHISASEWNNYVTATRGLKTQEAFRKWVELEVEIMNKYTSTLSPTSKALSLNKDTCFSFPSISIVRDTVVFEYDIDDRNELKNLFESDYVRLEANDEDVLELSQDADIHYFLSLVVASHSSIIIKYIEENSIIEIVYPYNILQRYCKIPFDTFSF